MGLSCLVDRSNNQRADVLEAQNKKKGQRNTAPPLCQILGPKEKKKGETQTYLLVEYWDS